jgi:hypothetical protein
MYVFLVRVLLISPLHNQYPSRSANRHSYKLTGKIEKYSFSQVTNLIQWTLRTSNGLIFEQLENRTKNLRKIRFWNSNKNSKVEQRITWFSDEHLENSVCLFLAFYLFHWVIFMLTRKSNNLKAEPSPGTVCVRSSWFHCISSRP